jgi:hypothetical protein
MMRLWMTPVAMAAWPGSRKMALAKSALKAENCVWEKDPEGSPSPGRSRRKCWNCYGVSALLFDKLR